MFQGCSSLYSVTFSGTATINDYAFYNCGSLKEIQFTNDLTTINKYAFAQCYSLEKFIIPNSVKTIGLNILWDDNIEELSTPFLGIK